MGKQQVGSKVLIIDAGGGTVDLSTYSFDSTSPITVSEVTSPDCKAPYDYVVLIFLTHVLV